MICKNTKANFFRDNVRGDKHGVLQVVDCTACGHRQLSLPNYDLALYEKDLQVSFVIDEFGTSFSQYVIDTWLQAKRRIERVMSDKLIQNHQNTELSFLDLGGGYGFFSHLLKKAIPNAQVRFLEPSQGRAKKGEVLIKEYDKNPAKIQSFIGLLDGDFSEKNKHSYDLVTLWHVLEHVQDPVELIANAWMLIKPGGWLSIEVPNANDDLLELSTGFTHYNYMIEHLSYFTPENLSQVIQIGTQQRPNQIYGYQRYGIFNYMHWIKANAPLGDNPDFSTGQDRWWLEKEWREKREHALTTDALVANIQKPNINN